MSPQEPVRRRLLFSTSSTKSVEWLMALFMLGWAVTLCMPGSTFTISSYRDFAAMGLTETDLAIGYGILGMGRVVLLIANGSFRRGPEVRFACSAIGAFTWFVTAGLFLAPVIASGAPMPVAASHHVVMGVAELYTIGVNAVDRHLGR